MEKLPMCRICLVEDVHMYVVVNQNLHELYEKLTDVPFITKDSRPMLACSFCCTKLKQCWRFQRKCLEAEEMFTLMMNEDYEKDLSINPAFTELSLSPTELFSIVDGAQTGSDAIKQELPDVSEELDVFFGSEGGHQTEKLELVTVDNSYTGIEDTLTYGAESDSEDVPLIKIKTEVVDESESIGPPVSKKPKLDTRESKPKDTISAKQKKNRSNGKLTHVSNIMKKNENHTSKRVTRFKEPIANTQHEVTSRDTAFGTSNRNNSNEGNIKCKISNNSVVSEDRNRCKVSVKEKRFKCHICPSSFSNNSALALHNRSHTGERPFKCDICPSSFSCKGDLTKHIRSHTGERPFKCDICPSSFSWRGDLTKHIRFHRGERPFKCDICPRAFTLRCDLKRHVLIHSGEKPFKCDICPSSFTAKCNLMTHKRIHTGEKHFKCDVCQKSFNQKSNLTRHICFHTGEKRFKCDICQHSFWQNSQLINHKRTHTGEKPFKCDICKRSFRAKSHLKNHIRIHKPAHIGNTTSTSTSARHGVVKVERCGYCT